ncbi:MAG: hypothetical protein AAGE38_18855, partial [Pseudomonadota bacterium]
MTKIKHIKSHFCIFTIYKDCFYNSISPSKIPLMSIEAYLLAAIAVSLTGLSKSGFAGGLGILGVPVLTLVMPAVEAAALLLPILVCIDVLSVWRYRA